MVAKSFRESNQAEEERSAKRRKTLLDSSKDANDNIYHEILTIMNGGSHEIPVLNLANFQNIIQ